MGDQNGVERLYHVTPERRRLLQSFAWGTTLFVLLLIFVGGMVKSTNSGLSVPDWPNTYGHFMFSFPLDRMVGGIFWEHSHRMLASIAGLLTFILTWLVYRFDRRKWVRTTAMLASIAVLVQGILGGLTVLLMLPAWTSSSHGTLAQIYLCLVLLIALAESRFWVEGRTAEPGITSGLRWGGGVLVATLFVQLILGAMMRHNEAGLVIPDFPTMFGSWNLPLGSEAVAMANRELSENGILAKLRLEQVESHHLLLHLLHRFWAVIVTVVGLIVAGKAIRLSGVRRPLGRWSLAFIILLVLQVTLGILTIYTEKNPTITTLHVVIGASLLGTTVAMMAHMVRTSEISLAEIGAGRRRRSSITDPQAHPKEQGIGAV